MNRTLIGVIIALLLLIITGLSFTQYYSKNDEVLHSSSTTLNETYVPYINNFWAIWEEEFRSEIDSGETILIDIRRLDEQDEYGIISEDQLHIIFWPDSFSEQILELDRNKKYLIYCWHGNRSGVARDFMRDNWFTWVKDLAWGTDDWNKSNTSIAVE